MEEWKSFSRVVGRRAMAPTGVALWVLMTWRMLEQLKRQPPASPSVFVAELASSPQRVDRLGLCPS